MVGMVHIKALERMGSRERFELAYSAWDKGDFPIDLSSLLLLGPLAAYLIWQAWVRTLRCVLRVPRVWRRWILAGKVLCR